MKVENSSIIESIDYNENSRELMVKLKTSDNLYIYHDVPKSEFLQFSQSESKGKYFNNEIRYNYNIADKLES